MMVIQSTLYIRLRASKTLAYLDGLEKAHISVPSQAKVTNLKKRPHLPEASGPPLTKRPRVKEEAQKSAHVRAQHIHGMFEFSPFTKEYVRIKRERHAMSEKSMRPFPFEPPYSVEVQLVNMMSGFRTRYLQFRHTPYTRQECQVAERKLMGEWLSLVARLGEWPPPFTEKLWGKLRLPDGLGAVAAASHASPCQLHRKNQGQLGSNPKA